MGARWIGYGVAAALLIGGTVAAQTGGAIRLPVLAGGAGARAPSRLAGLRARPYPPTVNGAFRAASGTTIGPAWVDGAYRAVETPRNIAVERLTITGLKATNLARDGIRLCLARGVLIEDFDLQHRAAPSAGRELPTGIAFGSNGCGTTGGDIVIRDGRVGGFRMVDAQGKYRNGDGIAIEGGYDRVLIERVVSRDNSDGCFDLKASNLTLRDLVATGCNRAFRIWSPSAEATTLTARDFNGAALWLGAGAQIHVRRFVAAGGHAGSILFRWEGGASLTIDSCDLTRMAPGAILTKADGHAAKVSLGAGCRLS